MPVEHIWGIRSTDGTNNNFHEDVEIYGSPSLFSNLFVGGKIFGPVAISHSIVGGNTLVAGEANINFSTLMGDCKVMGYVTIDKSCISDQAVITDEATVINSMVMGDAKIFGKAHVENALIGPGVIIKGDASIIGPEKGLVEFTGHMIIEAGEWTKPPISFTTSSGLIVTEAVDNQVKVNCTTGPIDKWLGGAGDRYGKQLGMTDNERKETLDLIRLIGEIKGLC